MWRTCQRDADEDAKASMVRGQLRVAVIGAQTEAADASNAFTVRATNILKDTVYYTWRLMLETFGTACRCTGRASTTGACASTACCATATFCASRAR